MKKQLLLIFYLCVCGNLLSVLAQNEIIILDLSKSTVPAEIEYTADGYWLDTYNDEDFPYLIFSPFKLSHVHDGNGWGGMIWDGFTISKNASSVDTENDWMAQWGCMAEGGIKDIVDGNIEVDSEVPYLVAYWSAYMESQGNHVVHTAFDDDYLYEPQGVYIANHPQAYYHNLNGITEEGDYFKLIIGGVDAEGNDIGTSVEHYLAWVEDGETVQPTNWEWVDLSALGKVKELFFTMESSDIGEFGINTPTYFCMSKLQVVRTGDSGISIPAKSDVKVYPTLFSDRLNIESEKEVTQIQLCDLSGRIVYSITATNKHYTIPTEELSKGVYILKLTDGTSLSAHKIIKK